MGKEKPVLLFLGHRVKSIRRMVSPSWIAGLAGLVFIVNGINLLPVSWIANRHSLIAATMGLISLLFYDTYNKKNSLQGLILSYLFFIG